MKLGKKAFGYCVLISVLTSTIHANDFDSSKEEKNCTKCGLCTNGTNRKTAEHYDVKKKDTLGEIAGKLGISIDKIVGLNNIKDPNKIYPGMRLVIAEKQYKESLQKYVVKENDTLGKIAKNHGILVDDLIKMNNIKNPNLIHPGMELNLKKCLDNYITYRVKENDTLGKIAQNFKTNVDVLVEVNNIKNKDMIAIGQTLRIPGNEKIVKVEAEPRGYVEVSVNNSIVAHKTTNDEDIIDLNKTEELDIKEEDVVSAKLYTKEGKIETKEVKIEKGKVTIISFIDRNRNNKLDIEDELITEGTFIVDGKEVEILPTGESEKIELEIGKKYDIAYNISKDNLQSKNVNIGIEGNRVFVPIEDESFSLKGNIKASGRSFFSKGVKNYENLLLRLKNVKGEEILFLPIDKDGNFFIDKIVKGEYFYDIEEVTNRKLKSLAKNKKIAITSDSLQIDLKLKSGIL